MLPVVHVGKPGRRKRRNIERRDAEGEKRRNVERKREKREREKVERKKGRRGFKTTHTVCRFYLNSKMTSNYLSFGLYF